jgi:hypothetical protein
MSRYRATDLRRLADDSLDAQAYGQLTERGIYQLGLADAEPIVRVWLWLRSLLRPVERDLQRHLEALLARQEGRTAETRKPRSAA